MKVIELRFTPFRLHFTAWLLAGTVGEHRFQNGHEREAICGVAAKKSGTREDRKREEVVGARTIETHLK